MACDTQTVYGTRPGTRRAALVALAVSPLVAGLGAPIGVGAAAVIGALPGAAVAQSAPGERTEDELLANFIHFIKIARYDVAASEGSALLGSGLSEIEFVDLVDGSGELERFQSAVAQALRVEETQSIAAQLNDLYNSGRLKRARDPEEIASNIALLSGNVGESLFARSRLIAAGEYAVPQLLETLIGGGGASQRARAQQVLIESGRQAVGPLSEALLHLESPSAKERILDVLAAIRYPAALPAVTSVYADTGSDAVRSAAARAIEAIGGTLNADPGGLYAELSEGYYAHREELTSFPGEDFQLMWDFVPGQGLTMRAVASEIYHETMALRMAERSLRLAPESQDTLALWIASAFRREIESEGLEYIDDVTPREAMYFAVASGPETAQRVLARGIDTRDTPLALRAIEAIGLTAGVDALTGETAGRRPLVEALGFHSRRVQIDAALAIASAQPASEFDGSDRVVPILASAIRNAGDRFAVVLTGKDREEYDRVQGLLTAEGYTVLPPADNGIKDIAGPIADAPGIDLIVASLPGERAVSAQEEARVEPRLSAAPMLILAPSSDAGDLMRRYNRDQTVMVRRNRLSTAQFSAAVDDLVGRALGGPIDSTEARAYSDAALAALRDLAVGRNTALPVSDAAMLLVNAIGDTSGETAVNIAEVLSYIEQPRAQVAVMDAALDASGSTQLDLLDRVAASARRFGNLLESRQVRRVLGLTASSDDDLAVSAATVAGALKLPNVDLVPLITGDESSVERAGR